ncbi:hypothetical protein DPMN_080785 [Dreissena polymorpha]|uniref:Uncharacterized protein n=1 Tax=Dreissena polymorpha TaxID=45954 RepID=A0A9D4BU47_DREPO|nr:hypothetical protein DPMN_080785 [Dreissena polymorpha]
MQWKSILRRHVTNPAREARFLETSTQGPGLSEILPKDGNPYVPYAISKSHPELLPIVKSVNRAVGRMLSRLYAKQCHKCSRWCDNIVEHLLFLPV